jgi:outer membrane protein TolC
MGLVKRAGKTILLAASAILIGCRASLPDVPGAASRLTGIKSAIHFDGPVDDGETAPAAGQTLEPGRAIRLTLQHDARIAAALAKVRVAEAEANQSRLLPNPILTLDYRFATKSAENSVFEPAIAADLLSLLQKPAQIAAADHRLRGSAAAALVTVLDVMAEVQEAYVSACSADAEIENAERRRQRIQRLRDIGQQRLNAGEGTRLDLLTLDSQLMQATLAVSDLRLVRTEQRLKLARLIGFPRDSAEWRLAPVPPPTEGQTAAESAWIDAAIAHRPEIQVHRWELRALGADLSAAAFAALQGSDVGVHGERDPSWRVGPTLTTPLPLFDFGQAARAKVRALRAVALNELVQQQREIIQDVRLAHASYRHARETLQQYDQQLLPLQVNQTDQARLAYQAGEADLAILLLAENELELTRSKILELQEKVLIARIKLQRAAGGAAIADRLESAGAAQSRPATSPAPMTAPATGPTQ